MTLEQAISWISCLQTYEQDMVDIKFVRDISFVASFVEEIGISLIFPG